MATVPANSAPSTNGRGGCVWYFPWACNIYFVDPRVREIEGQGGRCKAHVEKVEPRAVHVDEEPIRAGRRDGLRCILRELDFGWVGIFCDDERLHGWSE